ncbi:MAG TPA: hypothetical protein PK857_00415 [Hyphomicrobium sp.]|nr:hypothetical protein [Hyphomicrobium sp.]HRO48797.1 hypothetical protein [Hyphomicrobium sp.]
MAKQRSPWRRHPGCGKSDVSHRAAIGPFSCTIQRGGIYTWRLIIVEPTKTALPKLVAEQSFWKLSEAKAWAVQFATETAMVQAQPGAKGARRKSAAPAEAPAAPGAKT